MDLVATCGDAEFSVAVTADGTKWRIQIDDREVLVDAARVKPGTWSLLIDGRSMLVDVDESKAPPRIHTHQAVTPILLENAQRKRLAALMSRAGGGEGRGEVLKAPIAGRVVKVLATEGQIAAAGEILVILEAMKMENEIKCTRAGVVASIDVADGDSVETGAKLVSLKPEE
ncbi:MAG: biotin/lipoyl-binding protein [Myxococcales bacterium]|nr:biotin/lipoyl-binding protein [Myxococcales bacterium]